MTKNLPGHILSDKRSQHGRGRTRTAAATGSAPSSGPEYTLFRILDGRIEFPVFEEPSRVKCMGHGVDGLIAEYFPTCFLMSYRGSTGIDMSRRFTNQTFSKMTAPAGMKYPLYVSSSVTRFGNPIGNGHPQRNSSFTIAKMYGKSSWSEKSGKRSPPKTLSNSS